MLTQASVSGSDDQMLMKLGLQLAGGLGRYQKLRAHWMGAAPVLDGGNTKIDAAYARFLNMSRLNMADLIVTTATDRMNVTGFVTSTVGDVEGDSEAEQLWRAAYGPIVSGEVFNDMGVYGCGYGIVARDVDRPVLLRGEPWNTAVKVSPMDPWTPESAVNYSFMEDEQLEVLTLFRPGTQRQAVRRADSPSLTADSTSWLMSEDWSWADTAPVSLDWTDRVTVVPALAPNGVGQFEKHMDSLDRINSKIYQRLVIIVMQAFRQRALRGDLPQTYPANDPLGRAGQSIDYSKILQAGPAAMWMLPAGVDIWESATTDITGLLNDSKDEIKTLAAVTKTPLYVLVPDAQTGSAEGASLARETLVEKVEKLDTYAGAFMSRIMSLMFAAAGHPRTDMVQAVWAPPDKSSMAEKAQAASQLKNILPMRTIWREVLQFSPSEIEQIEQDAADDQFAEVNSGQPDENPGAALDAGGATDQATTSTVEQPVGAADAP